MSDGRTHAEDCWAWPGHHECAIARVREMEAARSPGGEGAGDGGSLVGVPRDLLVSADSLLSWARHRHTWPDDVAREMTETYTAIRKLYTEASR